MTTSPFFTNRGTADQRRESTRRGDSVETPATAPTVPDLEATQEMQPQQALTAAAAAAAQQPAPQPTAQTTAMVSIQAAPAPQPPPPPPQQASAQPARRQRVRIDPTVKTTSEKPSTPMRVAEEVIISHTASLRDGLANLLRSRGKEYLALAHRTYTKSQKIMKMEKDNDFIPISARVTFKLKAMKDVEELQGFKELQESVDEDMSLVQKRLKKHIIECAKLELKHLSDRLYSLLVHAIKDTVSLFGTAHEINPNEYGKIGCAIIEAHGDVLVQHLSIDSGDFLALFRAELNVTTNDYSLGGDTSLIVPQIKRTLEAVFVRSWEAFMNASKQQDIDLSLKKKAKEAMTKTATEATDMEVDKEISVDPKQLKELIAEQAKAELNRLLRSANLPGPKGNEKKGKNQGNEKRGRKPSASPKKKTSQDKKKPADAGQGDRNSASRGGKKKPSPDTSSRSSKTTRNGRRKGSQRS